MKVKRLTSEELYHYGIKGQRRGVRRFQNIDGSLTYAGKQRYLTPGNGAYVHNNPEVGDKPVHMNHHTINTSKLTNYGAIDDSKRKKVELGQRTEDKKKVSIHASEEAAGRRKLYDDNAALKILAKEKVKFSRYWLN